MRSRLVCGRGWGLYTYEQDWLHNAFLSLNATLGSVDAGATWLRQMGRAADRAGLRIQYCMAFPRMFLQVRSYHRASLGA